MGHGSWNGHRGNALLSKGGKQNHNQTDLQYEDRGAISQKTHDKNLQGEEKQRAITQDKVNGNRNEQKRENLKRNCGKKKKTKKGKKEKKRYN